MGDGDGYTATLMEDAELHWSDGDMWSRIEPCGRFARDWDYQDRCNNCGAPREAHKVCENYDGNDHPYGSCENCGQPRKLHKPVELKVGDQVKVRPGKGLKKHGIILYEDGDIGIVAKLEVSDNHEKVHFVWPRTNKKTNHPKSKVYQVYRFHQKAA